MIYSFTPGHQTTDTCIWRKIIKPILSYPMNNEKIVVKIVVMCKGLK